MSDNQRLWKATPLLNKSECEQILHRLEQEENAARNHRVEFYAMVLSARPAWRAEPELPLGRAHEMARRMIEQARKK